MRRRSEGWARHILMGHAYVPAGVIFNVVARSFDIGIDELVAKHRYEPVMTARLHTYRLLRTLTDYSFPQIAHLFSCDHSTVISGVKRIKALMLADSKQSQVAAGLEHEIYREAASDTDHLAQHTH